MFVGPATLLHAGSIEVSSLHVFAGTFAPTIGLAGWWVEILTLEPSTVAANAYEAGMSCTPFRCNGILLERALGDIMVPVVESGRKCLQQFEFCRRGGRKSQENRGARPARFHSFRSFFFKNSSKSTGAYGTAHRLMKTGKTKSHLLNCMQTNHVQDTLLLKT